MSWSVHSVGKASAVKAALASQFDSAKQSTASVPHECESVASVESIVNGQLDFLVLAKTPHAVRVTASGSAWWSDTNGERGTSVSLQVEDLGAYVE